MITISRVFFSWISHAHSQTHTAHWKFIWIYFVLCFIDH